MSDLVPAVPTRCRDVFDPACDAKVALYLDASVAKVFRAMGRGYQERINRLLRVSAQAELRWSDEARAREVAASARYAREGRGEEG